MDDAKLLEDACEKICRAIPGQVWQHYAYAEHWSKIRAVIIEILAERRIPARPVGGVGESPSQETNLERIAAMPPGTRFRLRNWMPGEWWEKIGEGGIINNCRTERGNMIVGYGHDFGKPCNDPVYGIELLAAAFADQFKGESA